MSKTSRALIAFFACWVLESGDAGAAVNRWTSHGPVGANLRAVAVGLPLPGEPGAGEPWPFTLYVATVERVWRSVDGGTSWVPILENSRTITHLLTDPSDPGTLYAGVSNRGVFKTSDGGLTWNLLDGPGAIGCCVDALALDPADPRTLYASDFRDLLRSIDGGETWEPLGSGQAPADYLGALAVDPRDPSILYAGTSSGGRLFRSLDGGLTWEEHGERLDGGFQALIVAPEDSARLYAALSFGKLYQSADGGASWSAIEVPPAEWIYGLAGPASLQGGLFAASRLGLLRSMDGGGSWDVVVGQGLSAVGVSALAIDPLQPETLYAGSTGIFKSTDGGASWTSSNSGLGDVSVRALAIDPEMPSTVYAGTTFGGVFKSVDGGATWIAANAGRRSSATFLVLDPVNPRILYSDGAGGRLYKSTDGAASWSLLHETLHVDVLAVDPRVPAVLYAGNDSLYGAIYKSQDGGESWVELDTGFDSVRLTSLAIDPDVSTTIYAGTSLRGGNSVLKSVDGGASWVPRGAGLPGGDVSSLAVDPSRPSTIYAGVTGDGVFRSLDGGESWDPWRRDLPGSGAATLALDPVDPSRLLAGFGDGVFEITAVPTSLGDRVWVDKDGDGIQGSREPGLAGVRVSLWAPGLGVFERRTTDADGRFRFEWLVPGTYTLRVDLPSGSPPRRWSSFRRKPVGEARKAIFPGPGEDLVPLFRFSPPDAGDDGRDSDVDPATGSTPFRDVAAGREDLDLDVGLVPILFPPPAGGES